MSKVKLFAAAMIAANSVFVPLQAQAETAKAVLAGGCFWCVEAALDQLPGVISTTSGYTGGTMANPTYKDISTGNTGHVEAVEVVYDPKKVTYEKVLEAFWRNIDPTVLDRQFCDVGSPYRAEIFYLDDAQKTAAQASKAALEKSKPFKEPVVTPITKAKTFYIAEEEHQDYYKKNPVKYKTYHSSCKRDERIVELWGKLYQ